MPPRACRACGCPIEFVPGPNGRLLPLDLRAEVYRIQNVDGVRRAVPLKGEEDVFVTHFRSCPKASDFSKPKEGV